MNCRFAREMIALWVGNDLSQAEAESVSEHVDECSDCQQHVEALMSSSDVLVSFNDATLEKKRDSVWPRLEARLSDSAAGSSSGIQNSRSALRAIGMISVAALTFTVAILPDYLRPEPAGHDILSSVSISDVSASVSDISTTSVSKAREHRQGLPRSFAPVYLDSSWQILESLADEPVSWQHPRRRGSL